MKSSVVESNSKLIVIEEHVLADHGILLVSYIVMLFVLFLMMMVSLKSIAMYNLKIKYLSTYEYTVQPMNGENE